ncbi:MAG: NADH:flavin oxidoreductase [bacterium]|jgi:NADPH2 dehydrogenase
MCARQSYPRISRYKTAEDFRQRLNELHLNLPVDDAILTREQGSPLAQPIDVFGKKLSNRWCIHPMEGWDGTPEGMPSEFTLRRWRHFGMSGAKMIFGGEAVAVRHDGRANPNQLMISEKHKSGIQTLFDTLREVHYQDFGSVDDLLIGLQLTHSGRFCRPNPGKLAPRILYHHPILDRKFGIDPNDDSIIFTDEEIDELIDDYVRAAHLVYEIGFDFVDLKHCHGYLGHEFLSAYSRPGKYGGSLENRTRFLRTMVERIRREVPELHIAVRLSAFDLIPFCDDENTREGRLKGIGIPEAYRDVLPYKYGFGVDENNPLEYDLSETYQFVELLKNLDIPLVNITCGSPYYNPHIQRPALFPPSDGYRPPEDPLVGVNRQIQVTRQIKQKFPELLIIGTGYTYLQDYLPQVAQAVVRQGWADFVGIGRMVLSYPRMPADSLSTGQLDTRRICRTFSDCTTAPRNGMVSGCFPLDDFYKNMPEAEKLKEIKKTVEA